MYEKKNKSTTMKCALKKRCKQILNEVLKYINRHENMVQNYPLYILHLAATMLCWCLLTCFVRRICGTLRYNIIYVLDKCICSRLNLRAHMTHSNEFCAIENFAFHFQTSINSGRQRTHTHQHFLEGKKNLCNSQQQLQ